MDAPRGQMEVGPLRPDGARPHDAPRGTSPVRKAPRRVNADMDRMSNKIERLELGHSELLSRLSAIDEELEASRVSWKGLDVIFAVARQDEFRLGRGLQRALAMRLVERLRVCPPTPGTGQRASTMSARQAQG